MKLQTTTRNLLLATLWIAVGLFCLLQMKTTDVVQTIRFISLPASDDSAIRAYQQISTEPVVVTRRDLQLTIKYARPTNGPIPADIDWQSFGYGSWTSSHSHHEVRTNRMFWYLIAGIACGLLTSARRRWARHGLRALQLTDNNGFQRSGRVGHRDNGTSTVPAR